MELKRSDIFYKRMRTQSQRKSNSQLNKQKSRLIISVFLGTTQFLFSVVDLITTRQTAEEGKVLLSLIID